MHSKNLESISSRVQSLPVLHLDVDLAQLVFGRADGCNQESLNNDDGKHRYLCGVFGLIKAIDCHVKL